MATLAVNMRMWVINRQNTYVEFLPLSMIFKIRVVAIW